MTRYTVRVGKACDKCHNLDWLVFQGYNQCKCGQYLWIIRTGEPHFVSRTGKYEVGTRFRYHQGPQLPTNYRGWERETAHTAKYLSKSTQKANVAVLGA